MFTQLAARRVADWLIQGGNAAEEREVYEFGLEKLFSTLTNFAFVLCFGFLFGTPLQSLVFYVAYSMLRVYAGGYHAEKPLICFFISIGAMIPFLLLIRFQQIWNVPIVFYGLLVLGVAILVTLGPVEHKNKPLDDLAKVVYRRRMLRNLMMATVGATGLAALSLDNYAVAVLCGVLLSAATAGAGKVKLG